MHIAHMETNIEAALRATRPEDTVTSRGLLELHAKRREHVRGDEIDRVEALKRRDLPSEDKWAAR